MQPPDTLPPIRFGEAVRVWAYLGFNSFGGPAGQIAVMHRVLVDERRWLSEPRFLHALNYCMLLPGPEAMQLATYAGWLLHGYRGGLAAGGLFVLPGAVLMMLLSALYAVFGALPAGEALFFGLKAAVLAIVVEALLRIGKRALRSRFAYALAAAAFVAIFFFGAPFPLIVAAAALAGAVRGRLAPGRAAPAEGGPAPPHTRPSPVRGLAVLAIGLTAWWLPVGLCAAWLGPDALYTRLGVFFGQMAVVTFGGAYAALAYVAQAAVETHGWLAPGQMMDGLALAETTPGPLILVLQFVGFQAGHAAPGALPALAAGVLAACMTLWATFAPCFLWIFLGAPYIEALRGRPGLDAALGGITAAVVGVILNLAVWFALHALFGALDERRFLGMRLLVPEWSTFEPAACALALFAAVLTFKFHVGMMRTLALAALAGLLLHWPGLG